MEVWENRNCCGNTSQQVNVFTAFQASTIASIYNLKKRRQLNVYSDHKSVNLLAPTGHANSVFLLSLFEFLTIRHTHYYLRIVFFKGATSWLNSLKCLAKLFYFVVCNPCQSSPSLTILVPLWVTVLISL